MVTGGEGVGMTVRRGIIKQSPTQGIISRRGMGMVLGGKFQVPPLLYETLHAYLPGIPLFVAAFMRGGIHLDVSTTAYQHIELCLQLETVQLSYTTC